MKSIDPGHHRTLLTVGCLALALALPGAVFADHCPGSAPVAGESHEEGPGEGEEAGPRLAVDATHDEVRNGVRLILAYDSASAEFAGTVENVSDEPVPSVRVEVHLSGGPELGPTPRIDLLAPGQKADVNLPDEGQSFTWWKAHSESGGGEDRGEHSGEGRGEHSGEHAGEHSGEHRERD
jgi:hypothetical protein